MWVAAFWLQRTRWCGDFFFFLVETACRLVKERRCADVMVQLAGWLSQGLRQGPLSPCFSGQPVTQHVDLVTGPKDRTLLLLLESPRPT